MKKKTKNLFFTSEFKKIVGLWLVAFIFCSLNINAQVNNPISLNEKNVTILSIIKKIEKTSNYTFAYYDNKIDVNRKISINLQKATIDEVLKELLKSTPYTYEIVDNRILISVKEEPNTPNQKSNRKVQGIVLDTQEQPVIGANVKESGTNNGVITDLDGKFSLTLTSQKSELEISYIGFLPTSIYPSKDNLRIILKEDLQALDEVIVIGYATQKKSDLTGSVGSIKAQDFEKQTVTRIDQALQGRISGVQITSTNGAPGAGTTIRIRGGNSINGSNEPLYVIDGIIGGGDLNSINPADIESLEVLKDASSTAIYGSRGANGVILITTKRGTSNNEVRLDYHGYCGVQQASKFVDFLNGQEYVEWKNENERYFGRPDMYDTKNVTNTNWQKEMYRTAITTEHNVSLSKGYKDGNYFFSMNYLNQDGVMKKTNFTRYQLRFNVDQNIGNYIKMGATLSMAYTHKDNPVMDSFGIVQLPNMSIYNEDGTFTSINPSTGICINTVAAQERYISDFTTNLRGFGNLFVQINPLKGLTIKSSLGFDINRQKQNVYQSVNLPTRVYNKLLLSDETF